MMQDQNQDQDQNVEIYVSANWYMSEGCNDGTIWINRQMPPGGAPLVKDHEEHDPEFPYIYQDDERTMTLEEFISVYGDWFIVAVNSGAT